MRVSLHLELVDYRSHFVNEEELHLYFVSIPCDVVSAAAVAYIIVVVEDDNFAAVAADSFAVADYVADSSDYVVDSSTAAVADFVADCNLNCC